MFGMCFTYKLDYIILLRFKISPFKRIQTICTFSVTDDTTRAGAGGRGNTSWEEGNRISQSSHAPRAVVLTEAPEIHLLSPDGGERGERFVLPPSAGKIIAVCGCMTWYGCG